jgi:hypothetical protein
MHDPSTEYSRELLRQLRLVVFATAPGSTEAIKRVSAGAPTVEHRSATVGGRLARCPVWQQERWRHQGGGAHRCGFWRGRTPASVGRGSCWKRWRRRTGGRDAARGRTPSSGRAGSLCLLSVATSVPCKPILCHIDHLHPVAKWSTCWGEGA